MAFSYSASESVTRIVFLAPYCPDTAQGAQAQASQSNFRQFWQETTTEQKLANKNNTRTREGSRLLPLSLSLSLALSAARDVVSVFLDVWMSRYRSSQSLNLRLSLGPFLSLSLSIFCIIAIVRTSHGCIRFECLQRHYLSAFHKAAQDFMEEFAKRAGVGWRHASGKRRQVMRRTRARCLESMRAILHQARRDTRRKTGRQEER